MPVRVSPTRSHGHQHNRHRLVASTAIEPLALPKWHKLAASNWPLLPRSSHVSAGFFASDTDEGVIGFMYFQGGVQLQDARVESDSGLDFANV